METKQTSVDWLEEKILNYDFNQGMAQMRKYILQAKHIERALNVKNFYDGKSAGEQSWSIDKQDVIEKHAIEFYKWMREVDTVGNAEQYFHFSNEDMYDVWLKEKKGHIK